jgi:hypothetical protein
MAYRKSSSAGDIPKKLNDEVVRPSIAKEFKLIPDAYIWQYLRGKRI